MKVSFQKADYFFVFLHFSCLCTLLYCYIEKFASFPKSFSEESHIKILAKGKVNGSEREKKRVYKIILMMMIIGMITDHIFLLSLPFPSVNVSGIMVHGTYSKLVFLLNRLIF